VPPGSFPSESDASSQESCPVPQACLAERALDGARENWRENWVERRSQERYPLGIPFSGVLLLDSGRFPPMPVDLVDISFGGACLLMSSIVNLQRGEVGELRSRDLSDPQAEGMTRRRVWVCWEEARDWITAVGVAFEHPLEVLPAIVED